MARWRLRNPHYLNILNPKTGRSTEWEYQETDQFSGETDRSVFKVPKLLDTADPKCYNYPGQIIVCRQDADGKKLGQPADIVFFGDPTPEMEPFDEEAEAISESLKSRWEHPIETLPANGGMNSQESAFMAEMMKAFGGMAAAQNQSVPKAEYDELKERLAKLEAMLAGQANEKPAVARRA